MTQHKLVSELQSDTEFNDLFAPNVPSELKSFCYDLRIKLRGCKVAPRDNRSMWVYMPNDIFAMGWVGYGEFRHSCREATDAFVVYSRKISNEKYAEYSTQYRMKMSVNPDVGMRNAKKFLRSYSPTEIADHYKRSMKSGASDIETEARHAFNVVKRDLFDTSYRSVLPPIATELKILLDSGYEFVDKTVGDNIRKLFETAEEFQNKAQKVNAYCVIAQERMGRQLFEVIPIDDAAGFSPEIDDNASRYTEADLPEDIAGKMAVLSMCQVDQYVPDVGIRAQERVFYVAR